MYFYSKNCSTLFFIFADISIVFISVSVLECPKGVPIVGCAVNPCDSATCALYTNVLCQANFCGGCFAEFYVNGRKVTCGMW